MKLIIGLGNPGPAYPETRHNLGFRVVDEVAERHQWKFRRQARANALIAGTPRSADGVLLAKPQTFMNLSGDAAAALKQYYRVDLGSLLVVVDDIDLALGQLRARARGSSGGHKGLASIIEALGSDEVPRLRIGVGRAEDREAMDHVLGRFESEEQEKIQDAVVRAAEAVDLFLAEGIQAVMNRYNRRPAADAEAAAPDAETT